MQARSDITAPEVMDVPALTTEVVLYAALALAGFTLRVFVLGNPPLGADEAAQALASFNFLNGRPDSFTGSPLLFFANTILFALFGANDGIARAVPALFGSVLVLLPALLRRELGRVGALVASALLAFSPTLVFFSRTADGAIIAVSGALAALAFGWRYVTAERRQARDLYAATVAAALALLSAPEVWMIVAGAGVFIVLRVNHARRVLMPADFSDGPVHAAQEEQERTDVRRAGILFLAIFLGIATMFLMRRDGLGATFNLFGQWLGGLAPGGSPFDPLRLLVIYEPVALFFGVVGVIDVMFALRSAGRDELPLAVLAIWTIVAFALYSIGGDKTPARVVVLVVPLALVAGWYIGAWLSRLADELAAPGAMQSVLTQEVPVVAFACALAGFLYLVLAEFVSKGTVIAADLAAGLLRSRQATADPGFNGLVLAIVILIAVAAVVFLAVTTVGWARSRNIGIALALALLSLWTFRQMAMASFSGVINPQEWLVTRATSLNVVDLQTDLEDISRWRANDSFTMTILADDALGPVVKWYVRDFRNARFETNPVMVPGIQALIVPANTPINPGKLMSQQYQVEAVRNAQTQPNFLRWLIFRDTGLADTNAAVLWIPQPQ